MLRPATMIALLRHCRLGGLAVRPQFRKSRMATRFVFPSAARGARGLVSTHSTRPRRWRFSVLPTLFFATLAFPFDGVLAPSAQAQNPAYDYTPALTLTPGNGSVHAKWNTTTSTSSLPPSSCYIQWQEVYLRPTDEDDFSKVMPQRISVGLKEGSYTIRGLENQQEVEIYANIKLSTHRDTPACIFGHGNTSDPYESQYLKTTPLRIYGAPSNVTAIGRNQEVDLMWDPISEATKWEFRYRVSGGTWPTTWTDITGDNPGALASHKVTGLTNGTTYNFQVRAFKDAIEGPAGETTATPVDPPAAPMGLGATPGNQAVTLTWTDPSNNTITNYQYQKKLSSATTWGDWTDIPVPAGQTGATMTSYTVTTGLTNDTEYDFRIRAIGNGGDGAPSDQSATATPHVGPNKPQEFTLKPGSRTVTLSWKADPEGTAAGSWQYRELVGGDPNAADANWGEWTGLNARDITTDDNGVMKFTRAGLTNLTAYSYELRGLSADITGGRAGGSPGTAAGPLSTTPHETPQPPTSLSLTPGENSVTLKWEKPSNTDDSLITKYQYQQSTNKDDQDSWSMWKDMSSDAVTNKEYTVTGLENGATYYFRIRAVTAGHESDQAPRVGDEPSTTPNVAPGRPVLGNLEPGNAQVKLVWTYTATENTGEVAYWEYQQRERTTPEPDSAWDGWTSWTSIRNSDKDTRETTVTGLTNARDHEFQVRAKTSGGIAGPASAPKFARPAGEPSTASTPTAVAGDTQVTLTWSAPDPANPDINEYQYCQKTDSSACQDSDWKKMEIAQNVATATTYTVTGLENGTDYTFSIRAVSVGGPGRGSDASNQVTPRTNRTPTFGTQTIPNQVYEKDVVIPELKQLQLPTATGGNSPLTYTLTPDLPNGLTRPQNFETGLYTKIIGTPTVKSPAKVYTWTVTDEDGETASLTFTIEVFEPTVTLVLDSAEIGEGDVATVKATLNHRSKYSTTVNISTDPATADFFTLSGTTLTIDADKVESTGELTITTKDNDDHGPAKEVTINAAATYNSEPNSRQLTNTTGATLTIKDNDAPKLTLGLNPTEISEDGGETTVTASLDKPASSITTVTIIATPVAPAVKEDFTLSKETITIAKGDQTGTATITAVDNDVSQKENKTITISATVETADTDLGLDAPDAVALTIIEDDTVAMEERRETATKVLTEVVRATLSGASAVIGQRFDAALGGPAALSVADWQVGDTLAANTSLWQQLERWDGDLSTVNRLAAGVDLLTESNFSLPLNSARGGTWSIWGRGDWRGFEGTTDIGDYDGSQRAGYLGVDKWLNERLMAGLALSHSTSETDYTIEDEGGRIDTSLTSIWPYLQNTMDNGAQLRLVLGIGKGEVEHYPTGEANEKTDLTMRAVSVAGKLPVAQPGDFTLSATAAASLADMKTEGLASVAAINGLHVSSWNLRAGLEAKHEGFPVSDTQWTLTPRVALALRQDGGDGVTGTGAELSGGLRLAAPDSRFALDASGYWLALHSQDGTKEWGASVEARFSPGEGGEGLSLSVEPAWGVPYQAGVLASEDLFEEERRANNLGRLSLTAHAGYGFALPSGLLTPFAEFTLPGEAEATRYAAGLNFAAPGGLDAKLSGERQDDDTRVGIDLSVEF